MIWILWHKRLGDLNQMVQLAKILELPYEIKKLEFRAPNYAPISSCLINNWEVLKAPYPELVICAEGMCSNIANDLKTASGGQVKTISLARPNGDPRKFDLVLTTAQYGLSGENIVLLDLPLTAQPPQISQNRQSEKRVVLVGGHAPPDTLDETVAKKMCEDFHGHENIHFVTSPRTARNVSAILLEHFSTTIVWHQEQSNLYAEMLASASDIIVTSDSVSMLADALVQQVPVSVYKLPKKLNILQKLISSCYKRWPRNFVFRHGLLEPTPDRTNLVNHLERQGFVTWFGQTNTAKHKFNAGTDHKKAKDAVYRLLTYELRS